MVGTADPYKLWTQPDGSVWAQFFHEGDRGYRIRFPGYADFTFDLPADPVICHPFPGTDDHTVEHLFLNQVLPLVRSMEGRLVLHASAVDVGGGTVLFIGLSGRGKSTLASYFATCGHAMVSDDGVVFSGEKGDFRVAPGHRSVRLWSDSLEAVLGRAEGQRQRAVYSDKSRLIDPAGMTFAEAPGPVAAIFHLDEPVEAGAGIRIERLGSRAALAACLPHLFLLDDRDPAILRAHFDTLSSLCGRVPQYRLHYPRRFEFLAALRSELLSLVNTEEQIA